MVLDSTNVKGSIEIEDLNFYGDSRWVLRCWQLIFKLYQYMFNFLDGGYDEFMLDSDTTIACVL